MRPPKNSIAVNRVKDPKLYLICKHLVKDKESYWKNGEEVNAALRKYGQRAGPLIRLGLLHPVWTAYTTTITALQKAKLIKIPNGKKMFEICDINNKKISYFKITEEINKN